MIPGLFSNLDGVHMSRFQPESGIVVREPLGEGPGYWCGAPGAYFDHEERCFYLYYRVRVEKAKGRGIEFRIARGLDGLVFEDIWSCHKSDIGSLSIEGGSIFRLHNGEWAVAYGFVDEQDDRWKIGMLRGPNPSQFNKDTHEVVLAPTIPEIAGVKDPVIVYRDGTFKMIMSAHRVSLDDLNNPALLEISDSIATGLGRSETGLATSKDGRHWQWIGTVLSPAPARWDSFCARVTGVYAGPLGYMAFYDGGRDVSENYEEHSSLAFTEDLTKFWPIEAAAPLYCSPYGTGSVRYVEPLLVNDALYLYYEFTRMDGGHQLRAIKLPGGVSATDE